MPLNEKMPTMTAIHRPPKPFGRNPPGKPVRLWKPVPAILEPKRPKPKMLAAPRMMNSTMAVTLMSANQNSTVPKLFTERELKYSSTRQKPSDHIQTGTSGNQYVMYRPAATASPPMAITWEIQYV